MSRRRIPLEIQEELRSCYTELVPKIIPSLGFNPFIRALLFFFSDLNHHLIQHIIYRGAELERAFEKGSYRLSSGLKIYETGCSKTEQALFDYMAKYVHQPYVPEDDVDYGEGYDLFMEQREQLKNELREEILDELRKPQDEDTSKD